MSARSYHRHGPIADQLRNEPRQWHPVRTYDAQTTAATTASSIRTGTLRAYQPAGHYEAALDPNPGGGFTVRARYIGPPATASAA